MSLDSAEMVRRLCIVLALLAMLWNGVAGAMVRPFAQAVHDEHAALHLHNVRHHHDDDGYHRDDSAPSVVHPFADAFSANTALCSSAMGTEWPKLAFAPPVYLSRPLPSPCLPHLRRPPRSPG